MIQRPTVAGRAEAGRPGADRAVPSSRATLRTGGVLAVAHDENGRALDGLGR